MLSLERILQQDRLLRAMTGLNRKAFEALLPSFAQAYEQSRVNPNVKRRQAIGGGRKATLRTPREKLFYILTGSTRKKRIIILTKARAGKVHDKRQLDEEDLVGNIPNEVVIEGDLGFQGLQNEFDNVHLPHKKPKGKELSEQQKQENRAFSRQRVKCVACFP